MIHDPALGKRSDLVLDFLDGQGNYLPPNSVDGRKIGIILGSAHDVKMTLSQPSQVTVSCIFRQAASVALQVMYDGEHVPNSPLNITVYPYRVFPGRPEYFYPPPPVGLGVREN